MFKYVYNYLPPRRRPGTEDIAMPPVRQSVYPLWKQSVQDFLSYRVHEEMSADAA